jgi:hypothetical protein
MLLQERQKGKQIEKEIEVIDDSINKLTQQLQNDSKGKEILEKQQLLSNITMLSNEVDKYSEMNNNLINVIKENDNSYIKLIEEIHCAKLENQKMMKILNQIELNKVLDFYCRCSGNNYSLQFNGKLVVIIGDFNQLLPVGMKNIFESRYVNRNMGTLEMKNVNGLKSKSIKWVCNKCFNYLLMMTSSIRTDETFPPSLLIRSRSSCSVGLWALDGINVL